MTGIVKYNNKVLTQLQEVLYAMDGSDYSVDIPLLYNSTIGKHCRHILEFYQCFFKSLPVASLNYDLRERNMRLETDIAFALDIVQEVKMQFGSLPPELSLSLFAELPDGEGFHQSQTTLSRELGYLADHTVHHLAIVKIGLALIRPEIPVANEIGIAASTINNLNR